MAAKFPPAAPYAVSLFFPDGTEVDDDDTVEVGGGMCVGVGPSLLCQGPLFCSTLSSGRHRCGRRVKAGTLKMALELKSP